MRSVMPGTIPGSKLASVSFAIGAVYTSFAIARVLGIKTSRSTIARTTSVFCFFSMLIWNG